MKKFVRKTSKLVLAAFCCCACGVLCVWPVFGDVGAAPAELLPLVQADSSLADWLERAEKCIADKDFSQAITILQALIEKPEGGFVAVAGSKSHYVSLRSEATRLLGSIPQAGLDSYRRLYDAKAAQKLADASAAGDVPALTELAQIFQYTSQGPAILKHLAAGQFDRGQFLSAAHTWQKLHNANLGRNGSAIAENESALLLAKIAVAFHLAGQVELSQKYASQLREKFPSVSAKLGGKDQNVSTYVSAVLARPVTTRPAKSTSTKKIYPGWGGLPTGQALMDDCDVILLPRWRYPDPGPEESNIFSDLATKFTLTSMSGSRPRNNSPQLSVELRDGRVYTGRANVVNKTGPGQALPPMLRPVVFGDMIIYRDDERIQAVDMFTGELRWESPALPMLRSPEQEDTDRHYYYNAGGMVIDRGQFGLTIGEDKIFTIHSFLPPNLIFNPVVWGGQPGVKPPKETKQGSALSAVSVETGKVLWTVGLGKGDDFLKTCIFISLPTYIPAGSGILYINAMVNDNYYVLCLQAQTGKLIWKTQVSQAPPTRNYFGPGLAGLVKMIATPPAVDGSSVFVCTNAGVIAAFDAASGQPKWAYQYPSDLAGRQFWLGIARRSRSVSKENPLIITDGLVIALPIDSVKVFALRTEDGKVVWQEPTDGLDHLAFVDDNRVVLGSEKIHVLKAKTGKTIFKSGDIAGLERPIVTKDNILLAGSNSILRISLKDYAISRMGPVHGGGLLGNLVSVGPALIAANSLGVCAYFSYEDGYDILTKRMAGQSGLALAQLLLQRAGLSFSAGKYDKTSDDLASCLSVLNDTEANTEDRNRLGKDLSHWLYVTELAKGNSAAGPDKQHVMMAHFQKALAIAPGPREKAHTLLRLAKCCEKFGDMIQAVAWAQKLIQEFPDQNVVDISIGPAVIDPAGNLPTGRAEPARQLGNRFIERLIKIHGDEIYASFNVKAQAELDNAIITGDPASLEAVAKRWPLSRAATEALFQAGEAYYRKAAIEAGDQAKESLAKATALLCTVAGRVNHHRSVSATTVLVAVYTVAGWTQAAKLTRNELNDVSPETPVAFADIQGTLGEVLKQIDTGKISVPVYSSQADLARPLSADINPPLREIFQLPGACILTDQEYRPVRIGPMVLVQQAEKTIMLDTSADTAEQASRNFVLARLNSQNLDKTQMSIPGMGMIAGRSKDGNIIVLCSKSLMTAFRVDTGKVLWSHAPERFGLVWSEVMGLGNDTLIVGNFLGKIAAVNFADGKVKWKSKIVFQPAGEKEAEQRVRLLRAQRSRQGLRILPNEISPPVIGGELAVFSHMDGRGRGLSVIDLKNGKLLDTLMGRESARAFITSTGLLVTMVDGELAIRNRESFDTKEPILTIAYQADLQPAIIGVSNQYVAVVPSKTGQTVELVSLHGSSVLRHIELKLETERKLKSPPQLAVFDGPSVYITFASSASGVGPLLSLSPSMLRDPLLAKFDTSTGRELWQRELVTEKRDLRRAFLVVPPAFGRSNLALQMRGIGAGLRCDILNQEAGEIVQDVSLTRASTPDRSRAARRKMVAEAGEQWSVPGTSPKNSRQINIPVITSGRLMVETERGITVYGE